MDRKRKKPEKRKDSISEHALPENARKTTKISKVKVKQLTRRIRGPRAASQKLLREELCVDLSGTFAGQSAKQIGDDIDMVRVHYEQIALKFVGLPSIGRDEERRSLCEVLRKDYETDDALEEFLSELDQWIRKYVFACIDKEKKGHRWKLRGYVASPDLMTALAKEYVRDRKNLMLFLLAAFKRWREIYAPRSPWRQRFVTQQVARRFRYNAKRILDHLQKIDAAPSSLTASQTFALLSRIKQYLSRDQRSAIGKNFGFGRQKRRFGFR
jgi:hypothetical protein